jgi:hypothetical protein
MKRLLSCVAIFLASSIFVESRAEVLPEDSLLTAARSASDKDDLTSIQAIESKALELDPDSRRQGDRLLLHLGSGLTREFDDKPECKSQGQEAKCQMYRLVAHARARGVFVVAKLYYESAEYLLVDDTSGEEAILRQFPSFSPSGKHALVLLMNDEQLGFAIQIWRRDGRRFVLEWSGSPHADGMYTTYNLVRWQSDASIELQSETSFDPPKPSALKKFALRQSSQGWKVVETP